MAKFGQIWVQLQFRLKTILQAYFRYKRVLIPEKAVLLTPLKTKWPFLAILWPNLPNMGLITVLAENNFTSPF